MIPEPVMEDRDAIRRGFDLNISGMIEFHCKQCASEIAFPLDVTDGVIDRLLGNHLRTCRGRVE